MSCHELITHDIHGHRVVFVVPQSASDSYIGALRKGPIWGFSLAYARARAAQLTRPLRLADFGANIGVVALPAAVSGATVLAVEALAANFSLLAAAVRENKLWSRLTPVFMAAYDAPGIVTMAGDSAWGSIERGSGPKKGTAVPADTIAAILQLYGFTEHDVLKIDIEGAELPALSGIEAITDVNPGMDIVFESNTHTCALFGYNAQEIWARLAGLGFSLFASTADKSLIPIQPGDPQPSTVMDILATKRTPDAVSGMTDYKLRAMTDETLFAAFETAARTRHPHYMQHVLRQKDYLPERLRTHLRWVSILDQIEHAPAPIKASPAAS